MFSSQTDVWCLSSEQREKHEKAFLSLAPINNKISGEQAKKYFMKSNLPTPILGQIWTLSDLDKDGRMTLQEFTIAMHLIENKFKGFEVPRVLPPSLRDSAYGNTPPLASTFNHARFNSAMPASGLMQPLVPTPSGGVMQVAVGPQSSFAPTNMGMSQSSNFASYSSLPPHNMHMMQQQMIVPQNLSLAQQKPQQSVFSKSYQPPNSSASLPRNFQQQPQQHQPTEFSATNSLPRNVDALSSLKPSTQSGGQSFQKPSVDVILPANRLKYTQMFRTADNNHTGFLTGEQAKQYLIQSGVGPNFLIQIWELSDINKDGRLELEEFIVSMHLIELVKQNIALPPYLPPSLVPVHLRTEQTNISRSSSVSSQDAFNAASFEDRRRMNWDKGQAELERRRNELRERQRKEKEEQERKEREAEEEKRRIREEKEQKRLEKLENERRQKEEMEREQEAMKIKIIEQRQQAQLEAERKRQREWEQRRMEELLNQKGLEQNIVNELKTRLNKLNAKLNSQTTNYELLNSKYEQHVKEGHEFHAAIEQLNNNKVKRMLDISRLQSELQISKKELSNLVSEREKFALELNRKDSTQTSEAVGAIRASIQQMKLGVTRLRNNLVSIETETTAVLKDAQQIGAKQKSLASMLHETEQLNKRLKQHCSEKQNEVMEKQRREEVNRHKMEAQKKKKEQMMKMKLEENLKRQKEQEAEALRKKEEIAAQLKQQQQQQQQKKDAAKVAPPRPRDRPHASPVKSSAPLFSMDLSAALASKQTAPQKPAAAPQAAKPDVPSAAKPASVSFGADFALAFDNSAFDAKKKAPLRPALPKSNVETKRSEEERLREEQREFEKEQAEINRLKAEQLERERQQAENERQEKWLRETEEEERKRKEQAERDVQRARQQMLEKERQDAKVQKEKEAEEEKKRKQKEMKRKIEEMRNKRSEKKKFIATTLDKQPEPEPAIAQYVKRTPYKLMFGFEARNQDELSLVEGDIVQVDENDSTVPIGWLRGTCNNKDGLFPANYASKIQNDTFSDYVDLDPKANIANEAPSPQKVVSPKPRPASSIKQKEEPKKESPPKLKPVQQKPQPKTPTGSRPKSALLPPSAGVLKPLQPVAPAEKPAAEFSDLFPYYDYVQGNSDGEPPAAAENIDELYSVPIKKKSVEEEPTADDIYSAPTNNSEAEEVVIQWYRVVALYAYMGKKDDQLTFSKDDVIEVEEKMDQWWFGRLDGQAGWFPKSYVKPLEGEEAQTPAEDVQQQQETSPKPGGECYALFEYAGPDGDLSFCEGDMIVILKQEGEWWQGYCNGNIGAFPANYVRLTPPQDSERNKKEIASAIQKYTATNEHEVSINAGQLVHVQYMNSGGWWRGEVQVRGKSRPFGWFPSANVKAKSKGEPAKTEVKAAKQPTQVQEAVQEDIYSVPTKRKDAYNQVLAVFSYTAQNEDELTFCKGAVINVLDKQGGEWWKGEVQGEVGVFPYNYVQDLHSDQASTTNQWSGSFDSTLLKSMSNAEKQRQNHIYELINTEQDYMTDLSLTLEVFYNPLAEANMLSEQELNTVFINWKELIMCNMKLLKAMLVRKKMSTTDKIEGIGDILLEQLPRFSPYIRFCSCMSKACRLLQDKVDNNPDFKQFEKKCAGDSRLKQNLPLSSYLLKPLQRITKYPLVISGILKYTPEDHYDRENLLLAHERAEDLCQQVNEAVRSQENSNCLEWLQERVNLEGLEEKLVFNSQTNCLGQRKYLYHGVLHKHKSNKELRVFLFNDFLLLCRLISQTKNNFTVFNPDSDMQFSIYKKAIFLNEVIVKLPSEPEVNDTLFHLSHIDRVYSFCAASTKDRNTWVRKLQEASHLFIETERDRRSKVSRARSLCDRDEVCRLVVTIMEGADLQSSDPTGTSDPYCEVSMGSQEHKTKVIAKDLNPKWNSTLVFSVKDVNKDVLCISVFDRDFFSPNDFLGRTEVSVSSIQKHDEGPITKRLLLHEVSTGEIVVTLELKYPKQH